MSDHKPQENILRKSPRTSPIRQQRMLLQLQRYDLNVTYAPGKDLLIVDTLSRALMHITVDDITDEKVAYALERTQVLSTETLEQLKGNTRKDETLQLLQDTHRHT